MLARGFLLGLLVALLERVWEGSAVGCDTPEEVRDGRLEDLRPREDAWEPSMVSRISSNCLGLFFCHWYARFWNCFFRFAPAAFFGSPKNSILLRNTRSRLQRRRPPAASRALRNARQSSTLSPVGLGEDSLREGLGSSSRRGSGSVDESSDSEDDALESISSNVTMARRNELIEQGPQKGGKRDEHEEMKSKQEKEKEHHLARMHA